MQPGAVATDEIERTELKYPVPDINEYYVSARSLVSVIVRSEVQTLHNNLPIDDPIRHVFCPNSRTRPRIDLKLNSWIRHESCIAILQ
jgi:hypothetical protein